jgi:hypothetical protein
VAKGEEGLGAYIEELGNVRSANWAPGSSHERHHWVIN